MSSLWLVEEEGNTIIASITIPSFPFFFTTVPSVLSDRPVEPSNNLARHHIFSLVSSYPSFFSLTVIG